MAVTPLPVLAQQADIRYVARPARRVLNPPSATGMPYWSLNPYLGCAFGCHYCYARFAHRYAVERGAGGRPLAAARDLPPADAFERRVLVKSNAVLVLLDELRRSRATLAALSRGERLVIGTATDPYQPAERRFGLSRALLRALGALEGLELTLITKSPLVARDVDVLAALARRSRLTVHVSLITLDERLARVLEPRAPTPRARLRAVRRLAAAGLDVGVNVMPVLPGLTDQPRALRRLVRAVAAAGARHLNAGALRLRAEPRAHFLALVERRFPELLPRYRASYARAHALGAGYQAGLRRLMMRLCAEAGLRFGTIDEGGADVGDPALAVAAPRPRTTAPPQPTAAGAQLALGV